MTPEAARAAIVRALNHHVGTADRAAWARKVADPNQDIRFDEIDVDSLAAAEVSMMIEDETGFACDIGDFIAHPSVQALALHISSQHPAGNG